MRILHITTFLQGGAGKAIVSLAAAQRRAGHQVVVIADAGGEPGYESYPEYVRTLAVAGVPFHTVISTFKRDPLLNEQAAARVREIAGPGAIDVVHAHATIPGLIARMALASSTIPPVIVHTMHGWGIAKTPEQVRTDLRLLGLADAVVTPSSAARGLLWRLGMGNAPTYVIPYGIESQLPRDPVDPDDAALMVRLRMENGRVALCIGTIGERKNQRLLVEALTQPGLAHVSAVFIGDGDAESLRHHARTLGVRARVHVLGHRVEASRYLTHADALVLPSRNEGLPLAILEALRAGVPVVASAIAEIQEALDDGQLGYLFEPGEAPALAAALTCAVTADAPQMRERLRAHFNATYSMNRMVTAYESLYEQARQRSLAAPDPATPRYVGAMFRRPDGVRNSRLRTAS